MQLSENRAPWDAALLVLALLAGVFLHWRPLGERSLQIDEHVSYWIADRASPGTLLERSLAYSATPPFSFIVQRASLGLFGDREWSLRLPGFVSYLAAIAAVWWLGRRYITPLVGGVAAVLFATHPVMASYAAVARPYPQGILLGIAAMAPLWRGWPASRVGWAAWSLANLALIQTHYLFGVLWIVPLVWAVCDRSLANRRRVIGTSLAVYTVCAVSVLPGLVRVWQHREFLNWLNRPVRWDDFCRLVLGPDWSRWSVLWLIGAMLAPVAWQCLVGRWHPATWWDGDRRVRVGRAMGWSALWFLVPVLLLLSAGRFWISTLAAERYLVVYLPALGLLLGGVFGLWRGRIAPLLGMFCLVMAQGIGPRISAAGRPSDDVTNVAWKRALVRPPCHLLWVSSGLVEMSLVPIYREDAVFHDYVSCRLGRMYHAIESPRMSLPMFWNDDLAVFYRRAVLRARQSAGSDARAAVWLYCATDTDVLRGTADRAERLLREMGGGETYRTDSAGLRIVCFEFSAMVGAR